MIISNQRSIEELSENTFELKQQLSLLKVHALMPIEISDTHLSPNDVYANAYNGINQLREAAAVFSQTAAHKEQYNLELKQRVENYAQMLQVLKDDPMQIAHDTLAQAFENIVKNHAEISEEYLGVFEEIATSLPKMLCDFANTLQNHTDSMVDITQTMDATKALDAQMRDCRIVEDLHNGTLGKYMEGDLPFINYLNSRGVLAVVDVEYVSKEVEAGKVKDRGITELINLLQEHNIHIAYKDVFLLRLLLIEHHKVVEVSTKNNKLDYAKNYLNQHKSLTDKAIAIGTTVSPPLRNPSELKILNTGYTYTTAQYR
jgi:F0F1-type ATP synthase membrane subunit b/b'